MYQIRGYSAHHNQHYVRIRKDAARRLFDTEDCVHVFMMPCNFRPENAWYGRGACLHSLASRDGSTFDETVNAFEYYQCVDSETGRYAAFYLWSE